MAHKSRDRHHGGQEPPDSAQDRPEQNAGYAAAVPGASPATPIDSAADLGLDDLSERTDDGAVQLVPEPVDPDAELSPDDRAERDVIAEVRRRERREP